MSDHLNITIGQITKTGRKTAVTEASTIGLAPGHWPARIRLWNGATFERGTPRGEGTRYTHKKTGSVIVVLND